MTKRQQFETWAASRQMSIIEHNNRYWSHDTHIAWQAWQAAQQHSESDKRVTLTDDGRLLSIWEEVMTKRGLAKVLGQKINGEVTVQLDNGDVETYLLSEIEKL